MSVERVILIVVLLVFAVWFISVLLGDGRIG